MVALTVMTDVGAGFSRSRPNDSSAQCDEHCGVGPAATAVRDRLKPAPTTERDRHQVKQRRDRTMKGLGVRKFFSTPKGLLILILTLLVVPGAIAGGIRTAAPFVLGAVLVAVFIDLVVLRAKTGIWEIPDGAILTGLFVAMVLSS